MIGFSDLVDLWVMTLALMTSFSFNSRQFCPRGGHFGIRFIRQVFCFVLVIYVDLIKNKLHWGIIFYRGNVEWILVRF